MIAYLNGEYLPHDEAKVSIDDRALMFGDSVFDVARTFGGAAFKMDDHLERLRRSLRYVELDADELVEEVAVGTEGVLERNRDEIEAEGDVWIDQIVTRGQVADPFDPNFRPTVIVKLRRLNYTFFGPLYERGVDLHVSLLTNHFAAPMDPRAKAANRLAATRAELKGIRMKQFGGGHWTIVFNPDGSVSETYAANICIVTGGKLVRPPREDALEGISLDTVAELAEDLGIPVEERKIWLYDLLNADETVLTATSFSLLPVNSVDGIPLSQQREVYGSLVRKWIELVGIDFVAQAERGAGAGDNGRGGPRQEQRDRKN